MTSLTTPLHEHHKYCDALFANAEAAVADADWEGAALLVDEFLTELETHFRTEETVLFPAFEAATGMTGGPTQMMRHEHAQMRDLSDQMRAALHEQTVGDFAGAAETLLVMMQQHNMKEENILYPMCDSTLIQHSDELDAALCKALESPCPPAA